MDNVNEIKFDPDEVQISTPFDKVNDRIESFLKRKREEHDDRNTRLYFGSTFNDKYCSSSRTCSTPEVKRQKGSECFVKLEKAHNSTGPLVNGGFDPSSENSYKLSSSLSELGANSDVHERISNLERCLNMKSENKDFDIYEKLKEIEDNVLKLQSQLLNIGQNCSASIDDKHNEAIYSAVGNSSQDKFVTNDYKEQFNLNNVKNEDVKPNMVYIVPKKSKYNVNDILNFIEEVKNNRDKKNTN